MPTDAPSEIPHPRSRSDLVGHGRVERDLAAEAASGRLHHAWLIGGPAGIGKATLAYRLARFLLADRSERLGVEGLAIDAAGRTSRLVAAGSHPNLVVLERGPAGEKAAPKTIPVEQVRKTLAFFASTAADGGRRVCIIDSLEDLNANGINALLKTVEEPPEGAVIMLLSHAPHRVLPTIRSRCRQLILDRLTAAEVGDVLSSLHLAPETREAAIPLAEGSVSRALDLTTPRRLQLIGAIKAALAALPNPDTSNILRIADRMADRGGEDFDIGLDAILGWAGRRMEEGAAAGSSRLAPLASACEKIQADALALEAYNLDRRAFVIVLFEMLTQAWRQGGFPAPA